MLRDTVYHRIRVHSNGRYSQGRGFSRDSLVYGAKHVEEFDPSFWENRQGTGEPANNPHGSARSRHIIDVHHFLRELVKKETVEKEHVGSRLQHADALTKPVETTIFSGLDHRGFLLNSGYAGQTFFFFALHLRDFLIS